MIPRRLRSMQARAVIQCESPRGANSCYNEPMTSYISRFLMILVLVSAVSIGSTAGGSAGHLIVGRVPNFGWNIAVHLQIDGRDVTNIVQGRRYHGFLPAGQHVLTVSPVPNTDLRIPTSITLSVQPRRTYVFNAMWDSNLVFLRPSGVLLSPGELWQLPKWPR
jgi:hypothetical protein